MINQNVGKVSSIQFANGLNANGIYDYKKSAVWKETHYFTLQTKIFIFMNNKSIAIITDRFLYTKLFLISSIGKTYKI